MIHVNGCGFFLYTLAADVDGTSPKGKFYPLYDYAHMLLDIRSIFTFIKQICNRSFVLKRQMQFMEH